MKCSSWYLLFRRCCQFQFFFANSIRFPPSHLCLNNLATFAHHICKLFYLIYYLHFLNSEKIPFSAAVCNKKKRRSPFTRCQYILSSKFLESDSLLTPIIPIFLFNIFPFPLYLTNRFNFRCILHFKFWRLWNFHGFGGFHLAINFILWKGTAGNCAVNAIINFVYQNRELLDAIGMRIAGTLFTYSSYPFPKVL